VFPAERLAVDDEALWLDRWGGRDVRGDLVEQRPLPVGELRRRRRLVAGDDRCVDARRRDSRARACGQRGG
jgi:hypothetical protein